MVFLWVGSHRRGISRTSSTACQLHLACGPFIAVCTILLAQADRPGKVTQISRAIRSHSPAWRPLMGGRSPLSGQCRDFEQVRPVDTPPVAQLDDDLVDAQVSHTAWHMRIAPLSASERQTLSDHSYGCGGILWRRGSGRGQRRVRLTRALPKRWPAAAENESVRCLEPGFLNPAFTRVAAPFARPPARD